MAPECGAQIRRQGCGVALQHHPSFSSGHHSIPEGLRLERTSGHCPVQPPAPARPPPAGVPGLFQLRFRHLQGWQTPPLSPQGMSSLHAQHGNGARGAGPRLYPSWWPWFALVAALDQQWALEQQWVQPRGHISVCSNHAVLCPPAPQ